MARGSVEKRISKRTGKESFRAKWDLGPVDPLSGKRLQGSSTHVTEKEAQAALRKRVTEAEQGRAIVRKGQTVTELANLWYEAYRDNWSPVTAAHNRWLLDTHILTSFRALPVQKMDAAHVQRFLLTKSEHRHIQAKCYRLLRQVCDYGMRLRMLAFNPVSDVPSPKTPHTEQQVWTIAQVHTFLNVAKDDRVFGPFWSLLVETGVRRGEGLGLRWEDVDLDKCRIRIYQAVVQVGGSKTLISTTKTPRSRRTVPISPDLRDALIAWKEKSAAKSDEATAVWKDHGLVFPTAVGTPHNPRNVGRSFDRLVAVAGVPHIRIHDIRHTSATLIMAEGASVLAVSKRLGHARPSTTSDMYGHVTEGMEDAATSAIANALYPRADGQS